MASRVAEFVPQTYTQLYSHYKPAILRWVVSAGISNTQAEDVAHSILEKFIKHDTLSQFDPEYDGKESLAKFSTFLSGFVYSYVRHHRDVQNRALREPTIMDLPASKEDGSGVNSFGDLLAEPQHLSVDEFETGMLLQQIRNKISEARSRTTHGDQLDLLLFFDVVLLQVHAEGRVIQTELATMFNVSATTIQNWLKRLRVYFDAEFLV